MSQVMCLIPPRADGTVVFRSGVGREAREVVFKQDRQGNLIANVPDERDVEAMLKRPDYFRRLPSSDELRKRQKESEREEAERKAKEAADLKEAQEREAKAKADEEAKAKKEAERKAKAEGQQ